MKVFMAPTIALAVALVHPGERAWGQDAKAKNAVAPTGAVQAILTKNTAYAWAIDPIAWIPDWGVTNTTVCRAVIGTKLGLVAQQPIDMSLYTNVGRRPFPLRWRFTEGGLWVVNCYVGPPGPQWIPTRFHAALIPENLIAPKERRPQFQKDPNAELMFIGDRLSVSHSAENEQTRNLGAGVGKLYADDPRRDDLAGLEDLPDGKTPFTYDFDTPLKGETTWTLFVQRRPRRVIEIVTLAHGQGREMKPTKVETVPSPFDEPFFAHRSACDVYLVTETSGKVFAALRPQGERKEWSVREVSPDGSGPVVCVVRDAVTEAAYACFWTKDGPAGVQGLVLPLDNDLKPRTVELPGPLGKAVPEPQQTALRFAHAVSQLRPASK